MKRHNTTALGLALAGVLSAPAVMAATANQAADVPQNDDGIPRATTQHMDDMDARQRKLDAEQDTLDRRQAALDRERHRMREQVDEFTWRFEVLDADDNNRIERDEASAMPIVDRRFDDFDTNNDDRLSLNEFRDIPAAVQFKSEFR